jgi:gamma-glutamyltranspeptidase/glutathione hydrolase
VPASLGSGYLMAHDSAEDRTTLYDFFVDTPRRKRPVAEIDFKAVHVDFGPKSSTSALARRRHLDLCRGFFAVHADLCR